MHNVLPIVNDKKAVLTEILRILKKGGKLSYRSGKMAKVYGNDLLNEKRLKKYLTENNFKIAREKERHIIFERV